MVNGKNCLFVGSIVNIKQFAYKALNIRIIFADFDMSAASESKLILY